MLLDYLALLCSQTDLEGLIIGVEQYGQLGKLYD